MKKINPNTLFIGKTGSTYKSVKQGKEYNNFDEKEISIVYQKEYSLDYYYYDIFSNKKYIVFQNYSCYPGDSAIMEALSFPLFVSSLVKHVKDMEIALIIDQKIKKNKSLTPTELKEFHVALNDHFFAQDENEYDDNNYNNDYNEEDKTNNNKTKNDKELNYITNLTNKNFKSEPAIGRDNEVKELIVSLALDKKMPILVGPSGTGKTTIVDELAYKIQKNEVPDFLKNKEIMELDMTSLMSGTKFVGTLESKVKNLIDYAVSKDAIVFIDEIHTIYGAGATMNDNNDVAGMIKQAIDRKGLRVIGTTTDYEYNEYFSKDALKRRFEKIMVKEPDNDTLYIIVEKVFNDYSNKNNIKLFDNMDSIISSLVELTNNPKHKTYDDKVCNPDLVIGIIDKIFADAKVYNQTKLTKENIIYGINSCSRVYDVSKEKAIESLDIKEEKGKSKIFKFKREN